MVVALPNCRWMLRFHCCETAGRKLGLKAWIPAPLKHAGDEASAAAGAGSNAQQTPKLPDYAVLDIANSGTVVLADFFDEQWRVK